MAYDGEGYFSRADVAAGDFAQSFQNYSNPEVGVLLDLVPRNADKADLGNEAFRRLPQLKAHGFVDDPEVTLKECQRLAEIFRGGCNIVQQPRLARICLLGKVKSQGAVGESICGEFEKLALRQGGNAILSIVNVAFREAGHLQERPYRDVASP